MISNPSGTYTAHVSSLLSFQIQSTDTFNLSGLKFLVSGNLEAKLYAKNIIGAGKVTFRVNGKEVAWIRAVDETDPKLKVITEGTMTKANYLVRTVKLNPGKNALEVYIDGVRTTRVAFSRK